MGGEYDANAIPKLVYAFTAFSLNSAAYMSETFRSALGAVDKGQLEACYSIHMTTFQALRRVILPQAFVIALPPLGNSLLSLVKDTSLAFSISIIDLMAGAKIVASRSFRFFEIYIVVSLTFKTLWQKSSSKRYFARNKRWRDCCSYRFFWSGKINSHKVLELSGAG